MVASETAAEIALEPRQQGSFAALTLGSIGVVYGEPSFAASGNPNIVPNPYLIAAAMICPRSA